MIAAAVLSMLDPATAVLGLACGIVLSFRVAIGALAFLVAACLVSFGLIPIMMPAAAIALAAWAATGWLAAWSLKRVRKPRTTPGT